jgi:protoporphyrinogen oxidase
MIILGGGLAGLAAGHASGAPVYEAAATTGGKAASRSVDGFVFDHGIHVLQTRNRRLLGRLGEWGVQFEDHRRSGYIYSHGRYHAYPFQVNTARLPMAVRLRCVSGFLCRPRRAPVRSYEEWMHRHLGGGFAETFLIPYSEKFWTVHPREMTCEWVASRVPTPRLREVLRGAVREHDSGLGTHVTFRYPRTSSHAAGYGVIARSLEGQGVDVHTGMRATRIDTAKSLVEFNGRIFMRYKHLISTLPLPQLVDLLVDAPEQIRRAASRLRHNSIFVVNLGVDRSRLSPMHWVHFPEREFPFFRISFPSNFTEGLAPAGTSSVAAEVAYSDWKPLRRQSIVEEVIDGLRRVGVLRREDVILVRDTMEITDGYVIYDRFRRPAVHAIHTYLRQRGIYPCGRYGHWAYLWSDQAIHSGLKTARSLMRQACLQAG